MNLSNLKSYLDKIEQNKPINLQNFINLIKPLALSNPYQPKDLTTQPFKAQQYYVLKIDPVLKAELQCLVDDAGNDRISAAKQNRSHHHKVDGSLLVMRQNGKHPNVVLFNQSGNFYGNSACSKNALLIENRQCFISIDKSINFLNQQTHLNLNSTTDVIFAVGNEISNEFHRQFLSQYEHLYLFFDLDLGGLKIAKNINNLLPNTSKEFIVPHDIENRLQSVKEEISNTYTDKVIKLRDSQPFLAPYAELIKKYKCVLEQESYLYGQ
ncbi:MAG: hypothetical protein HON94_05145 [Methylococcales bacterium]|jgi:5S rRNA maturation endonuclease (ribonuclease M5)|nr:hypothetical protein [Methylococcales bacterium]